MQYFSSKVAAHVSITRRPPSATASRALMHRFMNTCSTCLGSAHQREVGSKIDLDFDIAAEDFLQEAQRFRHALVEINISRFENLAARERQQLLCGCRSTDGLVAHLVEMPVPARFHTGAA